MNQAKLKIKKIIFFKYNNIFETAVLRKQPKKIKTEIPNSDKIFNLT
jgi:hypothetical protein